MSLREELEKAMAAKWEPDAGDDAATWLIRDHGQALLEALVDAERYRWLQANSYIELHCDSPKAPDWRPCDLDRSIDNEINAARSKTVDGGGV